MSVHAEVVAKAVGEESSTRSRFEDLLFVTLEDSDLEQAINGNLVSGKVDIFPLNASLDQANAMLLHFENNVVNLPGFLGEFSRNREGSSLWRVRQLYTYTVTTIVLTISEA